MKFRDFKGFHEILQDFTGLQCNFNVDFIMDITVDYICAFNGFYMKST